eukprot:4784570-Prymnesium_polylepis.1
MQAGLAWGLVFEVMEWMPFMQRACGTPTVQQNLSQGSIEVRRMCENASVTPLLEAGDGIISCPLATDVFVRSADYIAVHARCAVRGGTSRRLAFVQTHVPTSTHRTGSASCATRTGGCSQRIWPAGASHNWCSVNRVG